MMTATWLNDPDAAWSWDARATLNYAANLTGAEEEARLWASEYGAMPLGRSKWAGEACRKRAVREAERARLRECGCRRPKHLRPGTQ